MAVIVVSFVALIWMVIVVSFHGLDLRKRSSWLYGAVSFLSGLALGIALTSNLIESLKMGTIFAFGVMFTGAIMLRHKQRYVGMAKSLAQKYEQEAPSLFAKLVKILFDKYK